MKYFAKVSYSGEGYLGFQRQTKGRTVQKEIEKQLSLLCGRKTDIRAAGRTDTGVHALGQTFTFESDPLDVPSFLKAWNKLLPEDILILSLSAVDDAFDARFNAVGKVYRYQFTVNQRDPLRCGKIAQLRRDDFQIDGFLQGINAFKGTHNFQNFTTKPDDDKGFVRTVNDISVIQEDEGNFITVYIRGDGFMRYQIRFMIGASLRVAFGKLSVQDIEASLSSAERKIVPYKAPAEGLCLMEVLYEDVPTL